MRILPIEGACFQPPRFGRVEVLQYGAESPGLLTLQLTDQDRIPGLAEVVEFTATQGKSVSAPADLWVSQRKNRESPASSKPYLMNLAQMKKYFKPLLYKILKQEYALSEKPWAGIPVKSTDLPSRGLPRWPRPDAAGDIQDNALFFLYEIMKREPKSPAQDSKPA